MQPKAERSSATLAIALNALKASLTVVEGRLQEDGGYLVGRRFTVADLNAISCLFYLRFAPQALADRPAIRTWYDEGHPAQSARQSCLKLERYPVLMYLRITEGSFSKVRAVSDSPSLKLVKHYREEAKRARAHAGQMHVFDIREAFERIARDYDGMAEMIERRVNPSKRSD